MTGDIWKTLDSNDRNQVADQRFPLKQWFAGGAQSRGLRKPGCGHCYLRFSHFSTRFCKNVVVSKQVTNTVAVLAFFDQQKGSVPSNKNN